MFSQCTRTSKKKKKKLLPSDGRGEMCVGGRGKAVVVVFWILECPGAEVEGLHHAAGGHDAQHGVEERVALPVTLVKRLSQSLVARSVQFHLLRKKFISRLER